MEETIQSPIDGTKSTAMLRGDAAASYLGMSRSNFQKLVKSGRLPQPIRITPKRPVWRVSGLDDFLARL